MKIRVTGADDYSRQMKVLIVGEPGAGKTLISSTFPKPFFISAEGGLMSIADRGVPYTEVKSSDDLHEAKVLLENQTLAEQHGLEIETVVIDTIDEIQRILMEERMVSEKIEAFRIQDWGWIGTQMSAICRGFRNMPYHVVFTCHVKETQDGDSGTSYYHPALAGAIGDQLPGYVDLSLAIRVQPDVEMVDDAMVSVMKRKLLTFPTKKMPFLKDRSGKLPKEIEVNLETDFDTLNNLIYGDLDLPESAILDIPDKAIDVSTGEIVEPEPVNTNADTAERIVESADDTADETAEAPDGAPVCEVCQKADLGVDPDMGMLLYRKVLCKEHFDEVHAENTKE